MIALTLTQAHKGVIERDLAVCEERAAVGTAVGVGFCRVCDR